MISRRIFSSCGLCAAMGLIAAPVEAQAQAAAGGVTRRIVSREDVPGGVYETVQAVATVEAGALVIRHTHPGIESSFILEGGGTLAVKGRDSAMVEAGSSFMIPPETPHLLLNGGKLTRIASTYVVEKGKPLAAPAPE